MKVLHLSCVRVLTSGQRKQLTYEYDASKSLGLEWVTIALHTNKVVDRRFEIQIPPFFKGLFLRNLYGWFYMLKYKKNYDVVINRHMSFDPFGFFIGGFIKNRFTVHHAKEVEALKVVKKGWKGVLASNLEKLTGFINLLQVNGIIGVTNEICEYEVSRYKIKSFIYPNGIDLNTIKPLDDNRIEGEDSSHR